MNWQAIREAEARKRYERGATIGAGHDQDADSMDPGYTGFTRETVGGWTWPQVVDNSNDRGRRIYWWAPVVEPPTYPFTASCGHVIEQPEAGAITTGYGTDPDGTTTRCYACCNAHERILMDGATAYTAYLSGDRKRLTTWPGGELARVTQSHVGPWRYTSQGRHRMRYVQAVTPDGRRWSGSANDEWDVITVRVMRGE